MALALSGFACGDPHVDHELRQGAPASATATEWQGQTEAPVREIPGGHQAQQQPPTQRMADAAVPIEQSPDECSKVTQTAEPEPGLADIVWIIDGSPSMLDEIAAVQVNIDSFATDISSAGIDHHVVVIAAADVAATTALGGDPAHYRFVPALVNSNNSLQLLLDTYPLYADFLRPEGSLHFVVVTDDNAFTPHGAFHDQMLGLTGRPFLFNSIASEDAPGGCVGPCGVPLVCGAFAPGFEYYALSDLTGGQKISICTADWSQVFGPLKDAILAAAPLPCDYLIPPAPMGESLDPDKVNVEFLAPGAASPDVIPRATSQGECADNLAWFYDMPDAPSTLVLCPAACDAVSQGGGVEIAFGCETVPLRVD